MPVSAVFDNLEAGPSVDEINEQFDTAREQINQSLSLRHAVSILRRGLQAVTSASGSAGRAAP
jgi:uncharacterized protein (DUF433 family)